MSHSTPRTIDVSRSVMQRIEREGIRMRPAHSFKLRALLQRGGLGIAVSLSCLGFLTLAYVLKNDTFLDYRVLSSQGEFISSLPWPGITLTLVSSGLVAVFAKLLRKQHPNLRLSYAMGIWLVLILGMFGLGNSLSPDHTPGVLARAAYWSDKDPTKLYGEVLEIIDSESLKLKVGEDELIVFANTDGLKVGDKLLILGDKKDGKLYADAFKVMEKAPEKKVETKKADKKVTSTPKPIETAEEPKPVEPIPAANPEPTTTPTTTPKPTPEPEPTPGIKVVSKTQDGTSITIKYSIYPAMAGKCKTHLYKSSSFVASDYDWHSSSTSTCTNTIPKSSLTDGTWDGEVYFKYPYNVWSDYYTTTFTIDVDIP